MPSQSSAAAAAQSVLESPWESVGMDADETEEEMLSADPKGTQKKLKAKTLALKRPGKAPVTQASLAAMQAQMQTMQQMYQQMQNMMEKQQTLQENQQGPMKTSGTAAPAGEKPKENKSSKPNKHAALTGSEAPFPSLSRMFSMDVTFNVARSLFAQSVTYKWKILLLMMRMKQAVEQDSGRR